MKAVLIKLEYKKSGVSSGKTWHQFNVEFANGTKGTMLDDNNPPQISLGQEVDFDVKVNGQYTNIKVNSKGKEPAKGGAATSQSSAGGVTEAKKIAALNCATTLVSVGIYSPPNNDVVEAIKVLYPQLLSLLA